MVLSSRLSQAQPRSGGELLVACLLAHAPSLMTCVPGESFLAVLDALFGRQSADDPLLPRLITARHEAAAANMAEAAGKLEHRAAVCFVTRGPGAMHASIGLHTAFQDGTPMVLVVGQVSRRHLGREAFQEMDYGKAFASSAKSVVTIMNPDRIPEHVARAWHTAHTDRPGPVVLVVPEDVLTEATEAVVTVAPTVRPSPMDERDQLAVIRALEEADRPIILVGGPSWTDQQSAEITAFAERNHIPLATPFRWQDSVPNDSPSYVGYLGLGANARLRQSVMKSDLVIALGPRLDDPTTDGFALSDAIADRLWLISPDAHELCATGVPAHGIACGLPSAVAGLAAVTLPARAARREWTAKLREDQLVYQRARNETVAVDLAEVVSTVDTLTDADTIIATGAGNYTVWVQRFYRFERPGTQLGVRNGAMGYAVPAGLAAKALYPDRTVVAFAGDGCFMMSGNELATAVQHNLNLVVIVVNNRMFGTIRMHQERHYPGRVIATDLVNPDFVAYAASFGVAGHLVRTTAEFAQAFKAALNHQGPSLIEIQTDPKQLTPEARLSSEPAVGSPTIIDSPR
jgi:acetolactate synthase-1/2/3 large subunit